MSATPFVDLLLNVPGGPRVALKLWLAYPDWLTAEELQSRMTFMSPVRVKQVLKDLNESGLVERRERETSNPGVNPFEYRLSSSLFNELKKSDAS
jgi:DNA-binding HxlR family transcriptional regulator